MDFVLIKVAGESRPGVMANICRHLAKVDARVLDISQSDRHQHTSLTLLAGCRAPLNDHELQRALRESMPDCQLVIHSQPVAAADYEEWKAQERLETSYLMTVMAPQVGTEQLAAVIDLVESKGLNIVTTRQLSSLPSASCQRGAVQIQIHGVVADLDSLRKECLVLAQQHHCDIAVQKNDALRTSRRLVCFDMDSTLIQVEVIDELAKAAGVGDQVVAITEAAMRGELDFKQSFAKRMALLQGLDESVLAGIAERIPLTEGAAILIRTLRQHGYKTAILSGGFNYFARILQAKLGIDEVYANELEIVDGQVTGRVVGDVVDGSRKAALLQMLAERYGLTLEQVVAVGDGANDLPMLGLAGVGVAFKAKPIVRESARFSISTLGLDAVLYLLGFSDSDFATETE